MSTKNWGQNWEWQLFTFSEFNPLSLYIVLIVNIRGMIQNNVDFYNNFWSSSANTLKLCTWVYVYFYSMHAKFHWIRISTKYILGTLKPVTNRGAAHAVIYYATSLTLKIFELCGVFFLAVFCTTKMYTFFIFSLEIAINNILPEFNIQSNQKSI